MIELKQRYEYFPLYIRMTDQKIVVFGAGTIAARRVGKLLDTGAQITVIAPEPRGEMKQVLEQHPNRLQYIEDRYRPGCLKAEDMDFVFALTDDPAVNAAIVRECRHREILVNNASDHSLCDFYFPATIEWDELLIAIASTRSGDGTHAKTKELRKKLEEIGVTQ